MPDEDKTFSGSFVLDDVRRTHSVDFLKVPPWVVPIIFVEPSLFVTPRNEFACSLHRAFHVRFHVYFLARFLLKFLYISLAPLWIRPAIPVLPKGPPIGFPPSTMGVQSLTLVFLHIFTFDPPKRSYTFRVHSKSCLLPSRLITQCITKKLRQR